MPDYVLEGEKWGGSAFGTGAQNVTWALNSSVPGYFASVVADAFANWATYGNITFTRVAAAANPNIVFDLSYLDGANNTLGVTNYTYLGNVFRSAGITFDSGEGWHQSGNSVVSNSGIDLFLVALHEIGHSIGLDHYNSGPAIMSSVLNRSLAGLTTSDIDGIQAIYGPATHVEYSTYFGSLTHSSASPGGSVFSLYDAILDRVPDPLGLENFAAAVASGMSVHDLAQALLQSPEGQSHLGAPSNRDFVEGLYQTALHRAGDGAGAQFWTDQLNKGASRADVVTGFAFSAENQIGLSAAFQNGVFVADQSATDPARLYYGILDRAPDAGGLSNWKVAVQTGTSLHDVAQAFLNSAEFQAKGNLSDSAFVDAIYQNALGRHADAGGLSGWQNLLQHGGSRADVATGIAESQEAHQHLASAIEIGWHLA